MIEDNKNDITFLSLILMEHYFHKNFCCSPFFFLCPLYDIGVSQFENIIFFGVTIATNWVRKENACQSPSINPVFGRPLDLSETKLLICKTGQKMSTVYFFSIIMRTKKKKMYVKQM